MENCPFCRREAEISEVRLENGFDTVYEVACSRCGQFRIDQDFGRRLCAFAAGELEGAEDRIRRWGGKAHLIAGYVRERTDAGDGPVDLMEDRLNAIVRAAPERVDERFSRLLLNLAARSDYLGDRLDLDPDTDYPLGYCRNPDEFINGLTALKNLGVVDMPAMGYVAITFSGWRRVEDISESGARSSQAFVAMKFDDKMHDVYDTAISAAITDAGYSPLNMAQLEHVDPIDARILEEIDRSRFLVADVTGANQGVYFEAGYALGQDTPVIWSCHEDNFPDDAHFDTEHFNHIVWYNHGEFREKLRTRIVAVMGQGPRNGAIR